MSHSAEAAPSAGEVQSPRRVFMNSIKNEALQELSTNQKRFITSIRTLEEESEIVGESVKGVFSDIFHAAALFSKDLQNMPTMDRSLCDFFNPMRLGMQWHSSRCIEMTLAHNIYEEPEDKEAAIRITSAMIAVGRRARADLNRQEIHVTVVNHSDSANTNLRTTPPNEVAHNIAMRLKDIDHKFSGDLGESWMEYVHE
ncbi:unnamed protein product [Agarophyton chilense]